MGLLNTLAFITQHPLNRRSKIAALCRFARWQVACRLRQEAVAYPFVNGTRLWVRRGMSGATGNVYAGLHEFEDMAFVLHFMRPGDGFVDVGANVGSYTVLAGGAAGARCISIEPIPSTFSNLMDNIKLNGLEANVNALNIGIGREPGTLRFTAGLDTVNHIATEGERGDTMEVTVKTLDGVSNDFEPLLIKIDVEGFESNVIAGASKTLARESLWGVIMELNGSGRRYGFDEDELHAAMLGYGFRPCTYAPFDRALVPLPGRNRSAGNTLYLRNVEAVAARLKDAPAFHTNNGWTI